MVIQVVVPMDGKVHDPWVIVEHVLCTIAMMSEGHMSAVVRGSCGVRVTTCSAGERCPVKAGVSRTHPNR